MGHMQRSLEDLLKQYGDVTRGTLARPAWTDIESAGLGAAATLIYRELGGILTVPPFNLGGWDIEFEGVALELDEHLHFNR